MEGTRKDEIAIVELMIRFNRKSTLLWNLFGIGVTYLQSSLEGQSWLDTKIRNDLVPTRCDVGYCKQYFTQLGDENEHIASYEPEKGPNAIILATKHKKRVLQREFPGFVKIIEECADLENASKNLGFETGKVVVCPTYVELIENTLSLHLTCYVPKIIGHVYANKVRQVISKRYGCTCSIYRWQNP